MNSTIIRFFFRLFLKQLNSDFNSGDSMCIGEYTIHIYEELLKRHHSQGALVPAEHSNESKSPFIFKWV